MSDLAQSLIQLVVVLANVLFDLLQIALRHALLIGWVAWWLCGVNWKKLWPTLARGAWVPMVLLIFIVALVWSRLSPSEFSLLGLVNVPNVIWQFGAVSLLAGLTLFCGWLQGFFGWTPPEIQLAPAAGHHDHGHGDEHSHDHAHPHAETHAQEHSPAHEHH